jgi:hypothetical protein
MAISAAAPAPVRAGDMATEGDLTVLKKQIECDISASGDSAPKYCRLPVTGVQAEYWKKFCYIAEVGHNKPLTVDSFKFVACRECNEVFKYHSSKTGNTNIKKHECIKQVANSSRGSIMSYLAPTAVCSFDDKKRIIKALADFCSQDLRPFCIVEGDGFRDLLQVRMGL